MKCLVFHLHGPMAAWGNAFAGTYRSSDLYPSKSAIIGIISASMGIGRSEKECIGKLSSGLDIVVYVSGKEVKISDFHTVGAGKTVNKTEVFNEGFRRHELDPKKRAQSTIVLSKEYVVNGFYSVFLFPKDESIDLDIIVSSLKNPIYIPYLGRKSCPLSAPMCPEIIEYDNPYEVVVSNSLKPFLGIKSPYLDFLLDRTPQIYSTFEMETDSTRLVVESKRRDDDPDRERWQFSERKEYCYEVI